jgi:hypothetical protein
MLKSSLLVGMNLLAFSVAAHARPVAPQVGDTVVVTGDTFQTTDTARISFSGLPSGTNGQVEVYTGPDVLSGQFGTGGIANTPFSNLLVYCTDLYNYTVAPPTTYVAGLLNTSHQAGADVPMDNQIGSIALNQIAALIDANNADQSATQLAIWSVEYGSAFSFVDNNAQTTADVATYIANAENAPIQNISLLQLKQSGVQGLSYTVDPIPEPASMVALGVGLIGLCCVQRRRRPIALEFNLGSRAT